jgi:hypothetical protein
MRILGYMELLFSLRKVACRKHNGANITARTVGQTGVTFYVPFQLPNYFISSPLQIWIQVCTGNKVNGVEAQNVCRTPKAPRRTVEHRQIEWALFGRDYARGPWITYHRCKHYGEHEIGGL